MFDWLIWSLFYVNLCNDQLVNLLGFLKVGFQNLGFFDINSMLKLILWFLKYNWTFLTALEHASFDYTIHASYRLLFSILFCTNLQSALSFLVSFLVLFCLSYPFLSIISRKTRANRKSSSSSSPTFDSERFMSEKNQEVYEKLNLKRNI